MTPAATFSYDAESRNLSMLQHLRFIPLAVASAAGSLLVTDDGRSLLDLSASRGAAALGHGHPELVAAITEAARCPAGASLLSSATEPAFRLAEKLLACTPGRADRHVWIGYSGSDANETVARAVVAATGRGRILASCGAYHGGTAGSMAVSGHSAQDNAQKHPGLTLVPYRDPYRPFDDDPCGGGCSITSRGCSTGAVPVTRSRRSSSSQSRPMAA